MLARQQDEGRSLCLQFMATQTDRMNASLWDTLPEPRAEAVLLVQDGGRAAQAKMEPSRQSVEEVKRVVEAARKKAGAAAAPVRDFNEEDHYMDGAPLLFPLRPALFAPLCLTESRVQLLWAPETPLAVAHSTCPATQPAGMHGLCRAGVSLSLLEVREGGLSERGVCTSVCLCVTEAVCTSLHALWARGLLCSKPERLLVSSARWCQACR